MPHFKKPSLFTFGSRQTAGGGSGNVATDAIFDAKGDLPVGTGANTASKLSVGANDTMPVADSTTPTGIKWANPATVKTALSLNNVDNTSDATKNSAVATLTNKTLTSPVINTPTGIVKGDVGLGNVDNTSDANKPVSTAQQTALDLKANLAGGTFSGDISVPDEVYGAGWNGSLEVPTKNAVYDKIEALSLGGSVTVGSTAISSGTAGRVLYETAGNVLGEISGLTSDGTNATAGSGNLRATRPRVTTSIDDANGNEVIKTPATGSAVNEVTVTNAATGSAPRISATGDDANIDLELMAKGTGAVRVLGSGAGTIKLPEGVVSGAELGVAVLAPDETTHRLQLSNNNGSFENVVTSGSTDTLSAKTLTAPVVNNPTIILAASPSVDDTYQGTVISGLNNSGGVTQWDAVYLNSSSQWVIADANGTGTYPARGLAIATATTGNAVSVLVHGVVRNDAWAWTVGAPIYLSTTAGGLTQTAPSASGDKVQVVGFALSADVAFFDFNSTYLTVT